MSKTNNLMKHPASDLVICPARQLSWCCTGRKLDRREPAMNLGKESETVEHKRSTSELREGM